MCADQPAVRAQVNSDVNSVLGTSAWSSTTADQNSTLVASTRSGLRAFSSARAAGLERLGDLVARGTDLLRRPPQHRRTRILGAVDAVAEPHQPLAGVERLLDPALRVTRGLDLVEHLQHARGRAAVQRARERADRAAQRGGDVGTGGGDHARREVEAFMPCSAAEIQ